MLRGSHWARARADRKRRAAGAAVAVAMEPGAALTDAYDQALLGILQHAGGVRQFLHVLFGFLYRRTDFYRLLRRPTDRLGFPPGAARAMVGQVTPGPCQPWHLAMTRACLLPPAPP